MFKKRFKRVQVQAIIIAEKYMLKTVAGIFPSVVLSKVARSPDFDFFMANAQIANTANAKKQAIGSDR